MRKKIIGIVIVMLVITTALPAVGVMELRTSAVEKENTRTLQDVSNNGVPLDVCGKAWILLRGNESAMIGAKIKFFNTFPFFILWPRVSSYYFQDVALIEDTSNLFYGWYGASWEGCGCFRAEYKAPQGSSYSGEQKPYFALENGENTEVYVVITVK